ncbi:hypothetical protein F383_29459 [Gossypium arboreum]|uniref:Aminotransferase-like plant mobile domain-containing protein n=1 Tax=Gossypium arboreum TaxID=29729 RepID=A0A0B0MQ62_GOSAR|nr:hypothetical protein F383_29459 [Gossypium arboreum]
MEEIGMDPSAANPGPIDRSVLYDQDKHVSSAVWDGQERGALRCHEHTSKLGEWRLTPKQIELCPENATIEEIEHHTRAYLLYLVGSTIFSTTTGNKVPVMYLPLFENFENAGRYAWGAAALAFLYRALGNASVRSQSTICGCLTLLQCWSYYHLNIGRPKLNRDPIHDHFPFVLRWKGKQSGPTTNRDVVFYRKALDSLEPCDVEWLPYKYMDSTVIPEEIRNSLVLGRSKTMLICFDKAERHLPNRVLRQYGMLQPIPEDVPQWVRKSRGVDGGVDLSGKMESELNEWADRALHIVDGDDDADENEYMVWYLRITRKVVGRPISLSSEFQRTIGGVREISYLAETFPLKGLLPEQFESISRIRSIAQECLRDQVGGTIVLSPIVGTELGKRTRGKERVRRKGTGKRRRSNDPMEGHGASEDESQYCGMVEVDQLHPHHTNDEVDHLPLTVLEGEAALLLDTPHKVDDMQLHDATDGIDASHFCDASNEADNSNMLNSIGENDLQTAKTVEEVIPQSFELPDATNGNTDLEIHNETNKPEDSQGCNATNGINGPQTLVATDVNEAQIHGATDKVSESQPSDAVHSDQQMVKEEVEVAPQLSHENTEDLAQQGDNSVVA